MTHKSIATRFILSLVGLPFLLAACSGGDQSPAGLAGTAEAPAATTATDTGVPGEQFASLEVSENRLTGVFLKDDDALAFDVDHRGASTVLRLSNASGELLYSVTKDESGYELRVGQDFRGYLPQADVHAASGANARASSPSGFESTGDLQAAFEQVKGSSLRHITALAAALGRVGHDGNSSPIALALHLTAQQLTQDLGFQLDPGVLELSNEVIAGRASKAPADNAVPSTTTPPQNPGLVHAEGLAPGPAPTCRRAPCLAGQTVVASGPLAGCCISPAPPQPVNVDYSATSSCGSGVGRERFPALNSPLDPCRDNCLGMCGPGCDPWSWVCGDTAVHAACWNHDRVSCNAWIDTGWGFSVPDPSYPACMTEYAAYTAAIFAETVPGPFCGNTAWADAVSQPWWGLPAARASYFVAYK
jgi:hypothetical protein